MSAQLINTQAILSGLHEQGYAVVDNALSSECLLDIQAYAQTLNENDYKLAGIGRGQAQTHADIRSDKIHWLTNGEEHLTRYWQAMETLREAINREFYLGLFDYECHLAQYQPGSFYQKHFDAFRGQSNRKLSNILYLNESWSPKLGGELIIYQEQSEQIEALRVLPEAGRMVVFFSECFAHEVLPAKQLRKSLTGWFRNRAGL